jgi:hypothetical protein
VASTSSDLKRLKARTNEEQAELSMNASVLSASRRQFPGSI